MYDYSTQRYLCPDKIFRIYGKYSTKFNNNQISKMYGKNNFAEISKSLANRSDNNFVGPSK